jgi:hypothetical protein
VAAPEGGAEAGVVENVGAAQGEPLMRSVQRKQVRVLAVRCANQSSNSVS